MIIGHLAIGFLVAACIASIASFLWSSAGVFRDPDFDLHHPHHPHPVDAHFHTTIREDK